jgi:hypothetical protein
LQQQSPLYQDEYIQKKILEIVNIPNMKRTKRTSQQAMATNICGKKMRTHQDDEGRYVFTPT